MIVETVTSKRDTAWKRTVLITVFFLSGFASLLYQVSWQRLLTVYYGVSSVSVTLIVSVYLFGLGLGALLGGYLAERVERKILLYACIEAAIAAFGLGSPFLLDALGQQTAGSPYALAALYIFIFLSIPTFLMGTTLPLLTKICNAFYQNFARTLSTLYFVNTLGAAAGALIGSYVLISFGGLANAARIAAIINVTLAGLIFLTARNGTSADWKQQDDRPDIELKPVRMARRVAYMVVFCTGFLAIGYEFIWIRMLSVLVKDSPYAFASIIAEYLLGIAIGSYCLTKVLEKYQHLNRRELLLGMQCLISLYVLVSVGAYYYLTKYTAFSAISAASFGSPIHPGIGRPGSLELFPLIDIFVWPAVFLLVPTILMGASFPLISSLGAATGREGETVGKVYFVAVLGNVLGGFITGWVLLPYIKTEGTLMLFITAGMLFGLALQQRSMRITAIALIPLALVFLPRSGELYRAMHFPPGEGYTAYLEEGREGIVATYVRNRALTTYINGSAHGGRPGFDFYARATEAFGRVSKFNDALIIGYGTGSFVETALMADQLKSLTLVELNRSVIQNSMKVDVLRNMLIDPRVNLVIEDGRRYLLKTNQTFDVIMLDPLRSKTSGSNNLYSYEFFELLKGRLRPGGILVLWTDEFEVIPRTLASAFANVRYYTNSLLLASNQPFVSNPELRANVLEKFDDADRQKIFGIGQEFVGDQDYIKSHTATQVNRDWRPRSEYFIGLYLTNKFRGPPLPIR